MILSLHDCSLPAPNASVLLQLGTGKIPAGGTASIELSGPDARAMNNPSYYKHSEESKQLADVSMEPC